MLVDSEPVTPRGHCHPANIYHDLALIKDSRGSEKGVGGCGAGGDCIHQFFVYRERKLK